MKIKKKGDKFDPVNDNLLVLETIVRKIGEIKLKPNEYKLLKKLTEVLVDKIDDYELEELYAYFRQQLKDNKALHKLKE